MLHSASKAFFHLLARIDPLKALASRYGMPQPSSFARRFIAGETIDEAIAAARTVEARGVIVVENGRVRVRDRNVLRYYARSLEHLLESPSPHLH